MTGQSQKKIAVLIKRDNPHLEDYCRGLRDFAREDANWMLHGMDLPCYHDIPDPAKWRGDGCLVFESPDSPDEKALLENSTHRVSVQKLHEEVSSISHDRTAGIHSVLKHLAGQGCRRVMLHGFQDPDLIASIETISRSLSLNPVIPKTEMISGVIRSSTTPLGVIVPDCPQALMIQRLRESHQLPAILLVSLGDDRNCRLSGSGISSLAYPARELGYRTAQLLAHQLKHPSDIQHLTLRESKLNIRSSSQHHQIDDILLQKALAHIRLSVKHTPLRVNELADRMGISRTNLTERFQRKLGVPPADVIRRERLAIAKRRLKRPHEMVKSVALSMGFSSSQEFARFFKNATGQTPSQFVASRKNGQNAPSSSNLQPHQAGISTSKH